jgi:hypothetical protein
LLGDGSANRCELSISTTTFELKKHSNAGMAEQLNKDGFCVIHVEILEAEQIVESLSAKTFLLSYS